MIFEQYAITCVREGANWHFKNRRDPFNDRLLNIIMVNEGNLLKFILKAGISLRQILIIAGRKNVIYLPLCHFWLRKIGEENGKKKKSAIVTR